MCEVIVLFDGYSNKDEDDVMEANCSCTLIKGPKTIIVDTMTAWDKDRLIQALAQNGVRPDDIDCVVCTHGHADHIGNNNLFTNAEHIVGCSVHRRTKFYKDLSKEDYHPCEGVKITATPGHTGEDVTVLVNTKNNGRVAITGDLFEKEEDIADPSIWKEQCASEYLQNLQAKMRWLIINTSDFIVPGHGPMFRVTEAMKKLVEYPGV
ncbi:metallo-beta-lactamase domain-containing protein 1 [Leptopilina heterotoma]|uniref:metallo-beta-lactamase domain-containing protein 1 n=1 Tax=Leptopilina heterotoma TaxID=63436 RepID=UPI001CA8D863|nr:metallo-beta-lactamase domain-containing protein 1 [Leptopilina heterotoma]